MFNRVAVFAVFLLITIASCWSLAFPHLFPLHDYVHGARIAEMARGLTEGQFPVRWSGNFGYGYGMPLFQFYAPLPYYLGAGLYLAGVPLSVVIKLLFVVCSVGTMVGAFRLGSALWGRSAGLVVAAAYTLAPYRAVNLYIRGALGEAFGMMALPWVLYGCVLVWQRRRYAWITLVLSLTVLFLSHNLVTLIAVPCVAIWAVVFGATRQHASLRSYWQGLATIAGSAVLAAAMSVFYLVPAFLEKQYTKVESLITTGYFDYHLHFLYLRQFFSPAWKYGGSGWGADDGFSFFFGWGQWLGLLLAAVVIGKKVPQLLKKQRTLVTQLVLIGGLFVVSILLTTFKTLYIWETVSALTFVQFPWRFLSIAALCVALLASASLTQLGTLQRRFLAGALIVILLGNGWYFRPEKYLENDDALYYSDASRIRSEMSGILPDFIPSPMTTAIEKQPNNGSALLCQVADRCGYVAQTLVNHAAEKLVSVSLDTPHTITLAIAGFPGWVAEIDGVMTDWKPSADGLLSVEAPAGTHTIGARFGGTPLRIASDWISALALLAFGALLWWEHDRDKQAT